MTKGFKGFQGFKYKTSYYYFITLVMCDQINQKISMKINANLVKKSTMQKD
jgi:hypothetical protein